ncbi:MAG TPA: hypothetical protein PK771_09050, partial [Spirochaetota bacterium]|nr:hypothetical protein [Spirochaetota bacterium]
MLVAAIFASAFVSFIIVIIGRQLDKNNRSFEKIARLGKNIREDIESLVNEKIQYLKDFDNCIEVSSQKANYILDGLNKSIYGLEDKIKGLDNEKERISSFYQKIENIDKDIALISDQVQDIKESSDFFKSAMEKVNKFKKDVTSVESELANLKDDFKRENALSLRNISSNIVKEVEMQMTVIRKELGALYDETEEKNRIFQESINNKEQEIENRFIAKDKEWKDVIDQQANDVNDRIYLIQKDADTIETTVNSLKENFVNLVINEFKNLNDINNTNIEMAKDNFTKIERDITERLDSKINEFKSNIKDLEILGTNLNSEVKTNLVTEKDKQINEIRSIYTNILKEIGDYNDKLKQDARNSVIKSIRESEDKLKYLIENYKKLEKETTNKIAYFENGVNEKEKEFYNLKDLITRELSNKEKEFDNYIGNSSEKIIKNVNNAISKISNDAFGKTNDITAKFEGLYRDVEVKILNLEKDFINKTRVIETNFNDNTNEVIASLKNNFNIQLEKIEDYQTSLEKDIYDNINNQY